MSLTYSGAEPQPSLAWQFESSNVDYVTNLQPSEQVSPGPAQLQGGASLVTNAPSGSNTAVSFNGTTGSYMNLGTSPVNVDITTSNIFVEYWVYLNNQSLSYPIMITVGPTGGQWRWAMSFLTTTLRPRLGMKSNANNLDSSISIAGVQTWSHVAFSFNRTSAGAGTGYLFVNGQLGGSMAVTGLIYSAADTVCIAGYTNISGNLDGYIRDLRVVQGGVVPVANFTPLASAPFSYASPTYVANMGTTVFTLLGQFVTYPSGKFGQGLSILNYPVGTPNTGTKYVTYNNPLTLSATVGTSMSAWVNISKLPAVNEKSIFYGIEGTIGKLWIELYTTGTQVTMYNSTNYFNVFYGSPPSLSTWYHYAAVCDNSKLYFYVNGVLVGTPTTITAPPSFSGGYIQIGGFGYYAPFSGLVDDLRIYNTALTAAQVQSVYSSQGAPAPSRAMPLPKLAWDFNGTTTPYIGTVTSTVVNGTITYTPGKFNQAITFPNSSGTGANNVSYSTTSISVDSGITVSFWVKFNQVQDSYLFRMGDIYFKTQDGNAIAWFIFNGGSYPGYYIQPYVANQWYHLSLSIGNMSVGAYLNGALQATTAYTVSGTTVANPMIGAEFGSGMTGLIDDLRIFDRALTSAQVQAIYNQQGVPGRGAVVSNSRQIYVAPVGTYPTYTPTSGAQFPVFNTSNVSFYSSGGTSGGTVGQYLAFGSQTFNMSSGFSAVCQFAWTNGIGGWERIFDFGNGAGNNNILLTRVNNGTNLLFSYRIGSTEYSVTAVGSIAAQNTLYTVVAVYDPSKPLLSLYVNGTLTSSIPAVVALDTRTLTQTYIGRSNWTSDAYSNVNVNYMSIYNRVLTPDEITTPLPTPQIRLKGTPLFNQLSPSAVASSVGAFSLRAVNGTSARAVQVRATAPLPSFTASATSIGSNAYSQSLTGYSFGGTGTYIATGSSIYNTGTTQPWKAFDGDATTWWETTGDLYNTLANGGAYTGTQTITIDSVSTSCEWIKIQIPTGVVLSSYSMYARSGFTYRMPKNFKIAGSNDGATWTAVDTQTNQTTWTGQTPITFTTTSSTAYKYFALCVTAITSSGGTNNLNVGQWTLNGSWQTDFYADRLGNLLTAPVTGQTLAKWLGGATGYVTTWYNQIQPGQDVSATVAANQPTIDPVNKTIVFNGSTHSFSNTATTGGLLAACVGPGTKYTYTATWNKTGSSVARICEHEPLNTTTNQASGLSSLATTYGFSGQNNDNTSIASFTAGTQVSTVMRLNNTAAPNLRVRSNGTDYSGSTGDYTTLSLNNYWFAIGRKASSNSEFFNGTMKNVMVFKDAISDADTAVLDAWQQSL